MLQTRMASHMLFPTHQKEPQILMEQLLPTLHLMLPTLHLLLPILHLQLPILHLQLPTHHRLLPTLHNLLPTLHLPSRTLLHTAACQQGYQHPILKGSILLPRTRLALPDMEDPLHPL